MGTAELSSVFGQERDTQQFQGVFDARVTKSTSSTVHFVIPDFDPHAEFGPAPYPRPPVISPDGQHDHGGEVPPDGLHEHPFDDNPPEGAECAVAFVGGDPSEPRVLVMYDWPAP